MRPFKLPKKSLGDLEADVAARLIGVSADVALVLDGKGVIRDLAVEGETLPSEGTEAWIGRPWIDTVTVESRPKVEEMLAEPASQSKPRWRQVNHPTPNGQDLPVRYTTVDLGRPGKRIAIGRDLRPLSQLQQQIVDSQRQVEAELRRLRRSETRYRALFYSTSEAVLIVDFESLRVVDANPRAAEILSRNQRKLVGRLFFELFDAGSAPQLQAILNDLRRSPHSRDRAVRSVSDDTSYQLSAAAVREDNGERFLVARLVASHTSGPEAGEPADASLQRIVEAMPDAFVATDGQGIVQATNTAFLTLTQLAHADQTQGKLIDRWIGRSPVDVGVLLKNVREHGVVRRFNSVIRGEFGAVEDIEIAAVSALESTPATIGFVIRPLAARDGATKAQTASALTRSVDQMTELVGRVPLKELVRETTDIIERICIEAALQLTNDNRASAAEMLGLSRQGLYIKLRRHGLGDYPGDDTKE